MLTGNRKTEKLTEKEYRDIPTLSSTDIRLFEKDRRKFYKTRVLGEKSVEKYNHAMVLGSIVHTLLLEPDKWDEKYTLSSCKVPTALMLAFTEALYTHTLESLNEEGVVTVDFSELCKSAYEDSGFKIPLAQVLTKFSGSNAEDYYKELLDAYGKGMEVITLDDISIANRIAEVVKKDENVGQFFTEDSSLNEVKVEGFELEGIKLKAMLDKVDVDSDLKTIRVADVKVVYDVNNFYTEYFLKKRADIQGYIYYQALFTGAADLGFDYSDYTVLPPLFIAVDSGCFYNPLCYQMSFESLERAYNGFTEDGKEYKGVKTIIEDMQWSIETGVFSMTKDNYNNKGVIHI